MVRASRTKTAPPATKSRQRAIPARTTLSQPIDRPRLNDADVGYLEKKKGAYRRGNQVARAAIREQALKHILSQRNLDVKDIYANDVFFRVSP